MYDYHVTDCTRFWCNSSTVGVQLNSPVQIRETALFVINAVTTLLVFISRGLGLLGVADSFAMSRTEGFKSLILQWKHIISEQREHIKRFLTERKIMLV